MESTFDYIESDVQSWQSGRFRCQNCGAFFDAVDQNTINGLYVVYPKYCPSCGAHRANVNYREPYPQKNLTEILRAKRKASDGKF